MFVLIAVTRGQEIIEFPLPPQGNSAAGLTVGPDGNVWIAQNYSVQVRFISIGGGLGLANITDTGVITEYSCGGWQGLLGSGILGPVTASGNLWAIENGPGSNVFPYAVEPCLTGAPGTGSQLPSSGTDLTLGPDGNLWFILAPSLIGRSTTTGTVTTFSLPAGISPIFLAAGPDGSVWFTDYWSNKIGRMTTSGSVTLFDPITSNAGLSGIAAGPDGNLWFTEVVGKIGRITTSGSVTEFSIPTPSSGPGSIAPGADGAMWFTEAAGKIGRITTTGSISEIRVPYAHASPRDIIGKPDGTMWFIDSPGQPNESDRIGRLAPSAGCVSDPQTLCLNNGRFSVTAAFQTTPEGPSAPATAVPLTANTGYFWFFDPTNVEVVAKVLDGCSTNGHYWFFASGLTNVGVQINVTDRVTGASKPYSNTLGTAFPPVQDTAAFPCP
jgi:streptogramin lyase